VGLGTCTEIEQSNRVAPLIGVFWSADRRTEQKLDADQDAPLAGKMLRIGSLLVLVLQQGFRG
jgi:hypothetical protein